MNLSARPLLTPFQKTLLRASFKQQSCYLIIVRLALFHSIFAAHRGLYNKTIKIERLKHEYLKAIQLMQLKIIYEPQWVDDVYMNNFLI